MEKVQPSTGVGVTHRYPPFCRFVMRLHDVVFSVGRHGAIGGEIECFSLLIKPKAAYHDHGALFLPWTYGMQMVCQFKWCSQQPSRSLKMGFSNSIQID